MTDLSSDSLTNTLVLAFAQCHEQVRTIRDQSSQIERLKRENEQLKKELEEVRERTTAEVTPDQSTQTQTLFQMHVEAQAEIRSLKKKLKAYKEKTAKRLSVPLSSPTLSPQTNPTLLSPNQTSTKRVFSGIEKTTRTSRPASDASEEHIIHGYAREASRAASASPSRKRARLNSSDGRNVLREISANANGLVAPLITINNSGSTEKQNTAITSVAEDGDEHLPMTDGAHVEQRNVDRDESIYRRLDGLLNTSTPVKTPLARPRSRSPQRAKAHTPPLQDGLPSVSRGRHGSLDHALSPKPSEQGSHSVGRLGVESSKDTENNLTPTRLAPGEVGGKTRVPPPPSSSRRPARASEAPKPLRAQSPNRLTLGSFKPNPRWLTNHNTPYDNFLDNRRYERLRTLATTLPHLPGGGPGSRPPSDHDLLLDFLGPGSEPRIANLTATARANLLAEAKTRRLAQQFRMGRARPELGGGEDDGPPGFWSTDMPGTQEAEELREAGRQREREEVRRRYEEAMGGQGRWIFADE